MSNSNQDKTFSPEDEINISASKVVSLDQLTPTHILPDEAQTSFKRRFSTLFLDESRSRNGGLSQVYFASNTLGEGFALKVLRPESFLCQNTQNAYATTIDVQDAKINALTHEKIASASSRDFLSEAFEQEYETQKLAAGIKGFPRLYGKGRWNNNPVIIMEWIEGESLAKARLKLSIDDQGRLSPLVVAMIGLNLFDLLSRMDMLNEELIHRDISPSNIMISTEMSSIEEQANNGTFVLRLIDFGSAALSTRESSITERFAAPRGATPDFAAPEMLTDDAPNIASLRKSSSIDVYAAGSVLYLLLAGHAPFDLTLANAQGERVSPYRTKIENTPSPITMAHHKGSSLEKAVINDPHTLKAIKEALGSQENPPTKDATTMALNKVDTQLADIVLACLSARQEDRPRANAVRDALATFVANYAENLKRALKGEKLIPVSQISLKGPSKAFKSKKTKAQVALQVTTILVGLAAIVSCSILLDNVPVGFNFQGAFHQLIANGVIIGFSLLIPPALGAILRWRGFRGRAGFIRATIGVVLGAILTLVAANMAVFVSPSFRSLYIGAILVSLACSWLFFVTDFVFANSSKRKELRHG